MGKGKRKFIGPSWMRSAGAVAPSVREKICIAVPAGDGNVSSYLAEFIEVLARMGDRAQLPYHFQAIYERRRQPVEYARNLLVKQFLSTDADRMWFIDADIRPCGETLNVLKIDADIAVAWVPILSADKDDRSSHIIHTNVMVPTSDGKTHFVPMSTDNDQPREVAAAGTGCMVIRRRVIEDRRLWAPLEFRDSLGEIHTMDLSQDDVGVPLFRHATRPDGRWHNTEDFDFCYRARALGYSIRVRGDAFADHIKTAHLLGIARMTTTMVRQAQGGRDEPAA